MAYVYIKDSPLLKEINDSIDLYISKNDGCTVESIMENAHKDPIPAGTVNKQLAKLKEDGTIEILQE